VKILIVTCINDFIHVLHIPQLDITLNRIEIRDGQNVLHNVHTEIHDYEVLGCSMSNHTSKSVEYKSIAIMVE